MSSNNQSTNRSLKELLEAILNRVASDGYVDQEDLKYNPEKFDFTDSDLRRVTTFLENLVDTDNPKYDHSTHFTELDFPFIYQDQRFGVRIFIGQGSSIQFMCWEDLLELCRFTEEDCVEINHLWLN